MTEPNVAAVVLAAGKGKRMRSRHSKVLHHVSGRPMIDHVIETLAGAGVGRVIVVTGYDEGQVKTHLAERAETVTQAEQKGTGHAVMQAQTPLTGFAGLVFITCGDTPLWRADTFRDAIRRAQEGNVSGVVLTMRLENPTGYGRVIRDFKGHVQKIVEQKDATEDEARVREVNSGTYCFHSGPLFDALKQITPNNAQGEYYLTDVIEILIRLGHQIHAHVVNDATEAMGVNSRVDLAAAEEALQRRTLNRLMESGVTVVDPKSTWVDTRVEVGQDTTLYPNTVLRGRTVVGEGCQIGPNTELIEARIGDEAIIRHSVIEGHEVGEGTLIGPFATLTGGRAGRGATNGPKINSIK